jgi:hypothetical protein
MGTFFAEALLAAPQRPKRREPVRLLVDSAGDLDVLGAYTLEGFGLGIDPVQRKLIPAIQYGAATA